MPSQANIKFEYNCKQKLNTLRNVNGLPFCYACHTNIHDLTHKSNTEIKEFIKLNGGSICGQMYEDQIYDSLPTAKPFSFKLAVASFSTFFIMLSTRTSAQAPDSIKTEQHYIPSDKVSNGEIKIVNGDSVCTVYAKGDPDPIATAKKKYRKQFMTIGRRHFYITNKFPFIVSRKYFMGRYKW